MKLQSWILVVVATSIFTINEAKSQGSSYHIIKKLSFSGSGKWDYITLNPVNDNIYVSHTTQVNILNNNIDDSEAVSRKLR